MFRRIAANWVIADGVKLRQCVVELQDGVVTDYYTFTDELPFTEWLGGIIEIKKDRAGLLFAEWNGTLLK